LLTFAGFCGKVTWKMNINPLDLLKNAATIKNHAVAMQEQLKDIAVTGSAGGGIVKVTISGQLELLSVELDPIAVDPRDISMLQDLIVAAHHDAQSKMQDTLKQKLGPALSSFMSDLGS
jgi:DNA-binding YbaB/EbfC family protein